MRDHTMFFGKINEFDSADGVHHDAAFWVPGAFYSDAVSRMLQFTIEGWHDTDAFDAERQPIAAAARSYSIDATAWEAAVSALSPDPPQPLAKILADFQWAIAIAQDGTFWQGAT